MHLDPDIEAAVALDPDTPLLRPLPLADFRAEHDRMIAETVGAPEPVDGPSRTYRSRSRAWS